MRAVIQRVLNASVHVSGTEIAKMGRGTLTLLGVQKGDSEGDVKKMIQKIVQLRIFEDQNGKMNHSLQDIQGEHLIVSQFTLCADTSQGRRPSFGDAEEPTRAQELYVRALEYSRELGIKTYSGQFQADMKVTLTNDGPVTFTLETLPQGHQSSF